MAMIDAGEPECLTMRPMRVKVAGVIASILARGACTHGHAKPGAFAPKADADRKPERGASGTRHYGGLWIAVSAFALLASCTGHGGVNGRSAPTPSNSLTASPASQQIVVRVNGLEYPVPSGWSRATLFCAGPQQHTVNVEATPGGASCPVTQRPKPPPTAVTILEQYRPQSYGGSVRGSRLTWMGQPAWTASYRAEGATTVILSLPWLNATVEAQSTDADEAHRLAFGGRPEVPEQLVPSTTVTSVSVQPWPHAGDGVANFRTLRLPEDVMTIVNDLRLLAVTTDPRKACDAVAFDHLSANITLISRGHASRTYQARFDCGLIIGGTGKAGLIGTSPLRRDLRRLVPNSGL